MDMLWLLFLTIISSWGLTALFSRCAWANNFLDFPNDRSSHEIPTPRVGGIAIVLTFFLSLLLWKSSKPLPSTDFWALLGAGIWVSLVGFFDDYRPIPVQWRLCAHFAGAVWVLIWLDGLPSLVAFGTIVELGWFGNILAAVYLVWLLNLYNFMDGIDGLAAIESISVCLAGAILYTLSPMKPIIWIGPILLLAAAVLGFLFWNFPKAKIFMGDAGSGFLGLIFGVLTIQAAWISPELFWAWTILLGAFMVDATITLVWRILHRKKFYEAHRSHSYQLASQKYKNHSHISLAFGAINLFWLLPFASLVTLRILDGFVGMIVAFLPLALLTIYFKRGANPDLP